MSQEKKPCGRCNATGTIPCPACSGSGQSKSINEDFSKDKIPRIVNCSCCKGKGTKTCGNCGGSGKK